MCLIADLREPLKTPTQKHLCQPVQTKPATHVLEMEVLVEASLTPNSQDIEDSLQDPKPISEHLEPEASSSNLTWMHDLRLDELATSSAEWSSA